MAKAKQIKSGKTTKSALHPFRVVVRATKMKGKKALRVRKVFTMWAKTGELATKAAQPRIKTECKGLKDLNVILFKPLPHVRQQPRKAA